MKPYITLILLFSSLISFSQNYGDCFIEAKMKHYVALNTIPEVVVGDSAGTTQLNEISNITKKEIIGCKYPSSSLKLVNDKTINTDNIKTDFIILNFNYLYGGNSLTQLADLDSIKKQLKNHVTILSVFAHNKQDIQYLIDKYKININFVANANDYIQYYNLGLGTLVTFLLDKHKIIKFITSGSYPDLGHLYKELIPYLK